MEGNVSIADLCLVSLVQGLEKLDISITRDYAHRISYVGQACERVRGTQGFPRLRQLASASFMERRSNLHAELELLNLMIG